MIKECSKETNMYIHFDYLENVSKELRELRHNEILKEELPGGMNKYKFFALLHRETQLNAPHRKKRRVVDAVAIELLLPLGISKSKIDELLQELHKQYFSNLHYIVYLIERGSAKYLRFICSERKYSFEQTDIPTYYGKDVYMRVNENGKKVFAKETDLDAELLHKGTDIRSTRFSHFSNKVRKFTGNAKEFAQKKRQLHMMILSILKKLNFVKNEIFLHRINSKQAKGNVYTFMNIQDFNKTIVYMESVLSELERNLKFGYMLDSYKDLTKLRFKYQQRIKRLKFRCNSKVSISLNYRVRRDYFLQNLTSFQELFDTDIDDFIKDISKGLC